MRLNEIRKDYTEMGSRINDFDYSKSYGWFIGCISPGEGKKAILQHFRAMVKKYGEHLAVKIASHARDVYYGG
jgi:hypothetical protein